MKPLQDHPIASIFPLLPEKELIELSADIQQNGVQVPIVLFEDKILDGRNRYRAAVIAGAHCPVTYYHGEEPTAHVLSLNLHRRHLSKVDLAKVAVAALPYFEEEAKKRQGSREDISPKMGESEKGKASEKAAELVGVSRGYVEEAKRIKEQAPDVYERMGGDGLSMAEAKEEVRQSARRSSPVPEPTFSEEQQQRIEEAEKDSPALWQLKSQWKKTNKKDRAAFLAWAANQ